MFCKAQGLCQKQELAPTGRKLSSNTIKLRLFRLALGIQSKESQMFEAAHPKRNLHIGSQSLVSRLPKIAFGAFCSFSLAALMVVPAHAIKCSGDFQVQANGNHIATPYCQDNHLAQVAREYNIATHADRIRSSLTEKNSVCSLLRFDIRVQDSCIPGGSTGFDVSQ